MDEDFLTALKYGMPQPEDGGRGPAGDDAERRKVSGMDSFSADEACRVVRMPMAFVPFLDWYLLL